MCPWRTTSRQPTSPSARRTWWAYVREAGCHVLVCVPPVEGVSATAAVALLPGLVQEAGAGVISPLRRRLDALLFNGPSTQPTRKVGSRP